MQSERGRMVAAFERVRNRGEIATCEVIGPSKATLVDEDRVSLIKQQLIEQQAELDLSGYRVGDIEAKQVTVYGQAKLSNSTVISSTVYMRESKIQSHWVNVYYGPAWPITPCGVK